MFSWKDFSMHGIFSLQTDNDLACSYYMAHLKNTIKWFNDHTVVKVVQGNQEQH